MLNTVDQNGKFGVQRDLTVDVGLSVHEAGVRRLGDPFTFGVDLLPLFLLLFILTCLLLVQKQLFLTVLNIQLQLSDDAVLTLGVVGAIQEQGSVERGAAGSFVVGSVLAVVLGDNVHKVLDRQVSVSDDVLTVVLEQSNTHVEQLFPSRVLVVLVLFVGVVGWVLLATAALAEFEDAADLVLLGEDVGVNGVH